MLSPGCWCAPSASIESFPVPGSWTAGGGNVQIVPEDAPEQYLRAAVTAAKGGQTRVATLAKAIWLRAYLKADKLSFSANLDWLDLMPRYPHAVTEDERVRIEPSLRAMFGAVYGVLGHGADENAPGVKWAMSFWRQNWRLYRCEAPAASQPMSGAEGDAPPWAAQQREWLTAIGDIEASFISSYRAADPDLYAPDRHEVLTGITYRHLRAVEAMIRYPGFWTAEHGSPLLRSLVEARIVQKWLIQQSDPTLYTRFKDYGRGHLKLQLLHLREYRDTLDEDQARALDEVINSLDALVNRDRWEEFQNISIEGNFAGVDVRRMAEATGLRNEYRLLFAPTSATVHGEWGALDQHVLAPCLNPLHRGHRIPNTERIMELGPELVVMALDLLDQLVSEYRRGVYGAESEPPAATDPSTRVDISPL